MAPTATTPQPSPDSPIAIKVTYDGNNRKFYLSLKDLTVAVFVDKVRSILNISADRLLRIERFSDSYGQYLTIDPAIPASYKQLFRAAKAKSKLRLKITVTGVVGQGASTSNLKEETTNAKLETSNAPKDPPQIPELTALLPSSPPQSVNTNAKIEGPRHSILDPEAISQLANAKPITPAAGLGFQICCNSCDKHITDAHFHCNVCHNGDYDLCESCVAKGVACPGDDHWLIKRFIKNGDVVTSHTETYAAPRRKVENSKTDMPGAFQAEVPKSSTNPIEGRRTCNGCVRVLPEGAFITCIDCADYDLCIPCHSENKHGHHPGHSLKRVDETANISAHAKSLCAPGRGVRHHAICDSCDKTIFGVRHKCLDCPDFDFCNGCIGNGQTSHKHRFVPVYEPLQGPSSHAPCHYGIYCDGPLCKGPSQAYIRGTRYKCAICNDTDFCGNCEAHPSNTHSTTHPLIKFKTMIKDVSVLTLNQTADEPATKLGDRRAESKTSSEASTEPKESTDEIPKERPQTLQPSVYASATSSGLNAEYVRDTIPDGTSMPCGSPFTQSWVVRNPGPKPWPAGCTLHHIGGDSMLDLDHNKPASVDDLVKAMHSSRTYITVHPGSSHSFQVCLRAPVRPGRYISYWRVKNPDGEAFGHKLWCDIRVPTPTAQLPSYVSPPSGPPHQAARQELHKVIPVRPGRPASNSMTPPQGGCSPFYPTQRPYPAPPMGCGPSLHNHYGSAPYGPGPSPLSMRPINPGPSPSVAAPVSNNSVEGQNLQNKPPQPESQPGFVGNSPFGLSQNGGALADYQMQLMLLEQQNKRRLLMARQEQDLYKEKPEASATSPTPDPPVAAPTVKPAKEGNTMVFPTLEKESPSSSTHEGELNSESNADAEPKTTATDENVDSKSSNGASTDLSAKTVKSERSTVDEPDYQDVEDMSFSDSDDEEPEFLTDEEYDILDASDEELINGGASTTA